MIAKAYLHNDPSESTCRHWFRIFKNHNLDLEDKEREGAPKWFEDVNLVVILDKDPYQSKTQLPEALNVTQQCISKQLHQIGMVQKKKNWLPNDLTEKA